MSDLIKEGLVSLGDASRCLPNKPSPTTLWRWHKRGIKGIRLETYRVGNRRYTSRAALKRFFEATTAASDDKPELSIEAMQTDRSSAKRRRLREQGLLNDHDAAEGLPDSA